MHNLQALIQGKISPQSINIDELVELAKKYQQENSAEYKLIELAVNIVLAKHLEKAQKFL
jgi:transcription termination factor NusB